MQYIFIDFKSFATSASVSFSPFSPTVPYSFGDSFLNIKRVFPGRFYDRLCTECSIINIDDILVRICLILLLAFKRKLTLHDSLFAE